MRRHHDGCFCQPLCVPNHYLAHAGTRDVHRAQKLATQSLLRPARRVQQKQQQQLLMPTTRRRMDGTADGTVASALMCRWAAVQAAPTKHATLRSQRSRTWLSAAAISCLPSVYHHVPGLCFADLRSAPETWCGRCSHTLSAHLQDDDDAGMAGTQPWLPAVSQQLGSPMSAGSPLRSDPREVPSAPSAAAGGFEAAGWDPSPSGGALELAAEPSAVDGAAGSRDAPQRFVVGSAPQMGAARWQAPKPQPSPAAQGPKQGTAGSAWPSSAAAPADDFHVTVRELLQSLDVHAAETSQHREYSDAARTVFGDGNGGGGLLEGSKELGPLVGALVSRWHRSLKVHAAA